jgi:hypothetical protein
MLLRFLAHPSSIAVVKVALSRGPKVADFKGGDTVSSRFLPRDRFADNPRGLTSPQRTRSP